MKTIGQLKKGDLVYAVNYDLDVMFTFKLVEDPYIYSYSNHVAPLHADLVKTDNLNGEDDVFYPYPDRVDNYDAWKNINIMCDYDTSDYCTAVIFAEISVTKTTGEGLDTKRVVLHKFTCYVSPNKSLVKKFIKEALSDIKFRANYLINVLNEKQTTL